MHRTQVYLSEEDYLALKRLGHREGRSLAELVRTAVSLYLKEQTSEARKAILADSFGLLRDDEIDLREMRRGWSRRQDRDASPDR